MKRSKYQFISYLVLLLVMTLTAGCAGAGSKAEVNNPGQSNLPEPTATPKPQITEEFQAEKPETWSDPVYVVGNPKMTDINMSSDVLNFTLRDVETYVYRFYDKSEFDDVTVESQITNLGDNKNGISLVCRANSDGWYEFRVSSGGTYEVFRYEQKLKDRKQNPYTLLASGGSGLLPSKSVSVKFVCAGNTLHLYANGEEIKPYQGVVEDSTFTKGKIGLGVMSFDRVPVKVDFGKVSITKAQ